MKEKLARFISDWLGFSFLRLTIKERSDLTYKAYGFGLMPKVNYSVYLNWKNKNGWWSKKYSHPCHMAFNHMIVILVSAVFLWIMDAVCKSEKCLIFSLFLFLI